jgi:hypothetical protein
MPARITIVPPTESFRFCTKLKYSNTVAAAMNSSGTTGYPQTRYVASTVPYRLRKTKIVLAVIM